ncbi:MAG: hypothetical protein IKU58_01600 [Clostridia bacterium]|nr:hypothetical protein [Clostridia bacterium]
MTVKERILSIRLLEKAEKQVAFASALGLSWKTQPVSAPAQQSSSENV